tara:strand:- start:6809 stop:7432 length:624 start_codon:yes stop_codon:yes gene_type:complete
MFGFLSDTFTAGGGENGTSVTGTASLFNTLEAGIGAAGNILAGSAAQQSSAVRADLLRFNADTFAQSAAETIESGKYDATQILEQTRLLIGTQRASFAANGIVVDQDSALDLVSETAGIGAVDALIVIANSEREANQALRAAALKEQEAQLENRIGDGALLGGLADAGLSIANGFKTISNRNQDFSGSRKISLSDITWNQPSGGNTR